jgi:hypothetical protein
VRRLSAIPAAVTLVWLVPIGLAWLAALSMMSPLPGPALGPLSLDVLRIALVAQLVTLCLFAPQWHSLAVPASLLPAWPMLALLGHAAGIPAPSLIGTQVVAAGTGLLLTALTAPLRRPPGGETAQLLRGTAGVVAAGLAWLVRDTWLPGMLS